MSLAPTQNGLHQQLVTAQWLNHKPGEKNSPCGCDRSVEIAALADPIQGYDSEIIRSSAPGKPNDRSNVKIGNINTTPEEVNTRTMRDVTEVTRKNASIDIDNTPAKGLGAQCLSKLQTIPGRFDTASLT